MRGVESVQTGDSTAPQAPGRCPLNRLPRASPQIAMESKIPRIHAGGGSSPRQIVLARRAGQEWPEGWTRSPEGQSPLGGIPPEGNPTAESHPGGDTCRTDISQGGRAGHRVGRMAPPATSTAATPQRAVRQRSTESFRKDFLGTISLGRQRDSDPPGKSFRKDLAKEKAQRAQKKGPMGPKKGPNGPFQNAPRPLPGRNPSGRIFPSGRILWARPQLTAGCRPPCHPIPRAWAPIPEARPRPGGVGLSW